MADDHIVPQASQTVVTMVRTLASKLVDVIGCTTGIALSAHLRLAASVQQAAACTTLEAVQMGADLSNFIERV